MQDRGPLMKPTSPAPWANTTQMAENTCSRHTEAAGDGSKAQCVSTKSERNTRQGQLARWLEPPAGQPTTPTTNTHLQVAK
jgi:hypothetical protein